MSDEKVLTKEIAEQYSENEYSVFLDEYTCIEDDAAEILGRLKSESLCLASITSLSDAAAGHLSKFQGESIDLMELSNLPDSVASHLCDFQGEITLNGLRHISKQLSSILSTFSSSKIELHSLETISDDAASCLGNYKGVLSLRANQLSENAASHLIKCNGPLLIDLAELPDAVQAILLRKESVAEMYGLESRNVGAILLDGIEEAVESASLYFSSDRKSDILGPTLSRLVVRGTGKSCFQLACFADGLRVVVKATRAEHELSDEEIGDKLNDADAFIQKAVDIFAKYCRNYSRFEERKQHSLIDFIRFYIADSGPFGLSAQATAWSSIKTCEQLVNLFEDDSALEILRITFVDAAKKYLDEDEISNIEFLGELAVDIEPHESDEMYDSALATDNGDVLTKEIAEQFLEDEDSVDLSQFTAIDHDAAELLGQSGSDLQFGSLDQLTADCAVALGLSASEYSELTFETISSIDDDAAIALSQYEGTLDIRDYISSTSPASFALVAKMGRVPSISRACDKSLALAARISREELDLSGLQDIDACQAAALRPYKGTLILNGIESVDYKAALTLCSLPSEIEMTELDLSQNTDIAFLACKIGRLSELTDLSASQAQTLASLNSHLDLSGLKQLTREVAMVLASHDGKTLTDWDGKFGITLDGLTEISKETAEALAGYSGECISLLGLETLSDAAAGCLSEYPEQLVLPTEESDAGRWILSLKCMDEGDGFARLKSKISEQDGPEIRMAT